MSETEELQKQIEGLEKRITALEHIISGTASGKVGRKPKLTLKQKQDILEKRSSGVSYAKLSGEYSVSKSTICNVCKGYQNNQMVIDVMIVGKTRGKSTP